MRNDDFTHVTGTVLRLLIGKSVVNLASQTVAKGAFEEHQCQAGGADDQVDRPDSVIDYDQIEHQYGQRQANCPGKTFLRCACPFRHLLSRR